MPWLLQREVIRSPMSPSIEYHQLHDCRQRRNLPNEFLLCFAPRLICRGTFEPKVSLMARVGIEAPNPNEGCQVCGRQGVGSWLGHKLVDVGFCWSGSSSVFGRWFVSSGS